ncbi:MAG: hypothetical protein PSV24_15950 [Rhodoferax sp.]|nr:hypothetical protein [Rhodoferax sp.]
MKPDETQRYVKDIPRQRTARNIHPMNTQTFTLNQPTAWLLQSRIWSTVFGVLLLCAGTAQAAEPQQSAAKRPLDLSVPQDANALEAWRKKQSLERQNSKPYGSGYEARGLEGRNDNSADVTLLPSSRTADKDSAASGRSVGGTSGGGNGGSGGGGGGRGR